MALSNNRKRSSPTRDGSHTAYRASDRASGTLSLRTTTTGDEPQPPTSTVQQASAPAADTPTPAKARPPLPTARLRTAYEPKTAPEPSFHHPQPKVHHMDKNKQTHWLQPSDDEMDPTASASTGQPLPPATRPIRPPGSDVWWVAEPITNPDSPRHQPKPTGSGWVSYDGSWWRNYWHLHGNSVPEEATRACPAEYTYSHDPAFWYNSQVWVHPYRPEHDAFLKEKKPKPSAAFKAPPTMPTPSASFPPANSQYSPRMEFKWGEPSEPPAPGFDKPGQTKPSSLYNVRNEQKALAQLHQGYAIWIRGRWKWAPRTALNSPAIPCSATTTTATICVALSPVVRSLNAHTTAFAASTLMEKATSAAMNAAAAMSRKAMASSLDRSELKARSSQSSHSLDQAFKPPESMANRAILILIRISMKN